MSDTQLTMEAIERIEDLLLTGPALDIRYWDDPVLSAVCSPIKEDEFGPKLVEFGTKLTEAMFRYRGVGLAAPQVGVTKRVFVMQFPDHEGMPPRVICNPVVIPEGVDVQHEEGCLSLPGVREQVLRPRSVILRYQDLEGDEHRLQLDNLDARIVQHENDHLNGIMFFDRRRMPRNLSRAVERRWEKERVKYGG